jgi:hypothetical protein
MLCEYVGRHGLFKESWGNTADKEECCRIGYKDSSGWGVENGIKGSVERQSTDLAI